MKSKGTAIVISSALLFGFGLLAVGWVPVRRSQAATSVARMSNGGPGGLTGPRPLIALVVHNPWTWRLKWEPIFVLYDDGTVIYVREGPSDGVYVSAKLSPQRVSHLLHRVRRQTDTLESFYDSSNGTSDLLTHRLWLREADGTSKVIETYGPIEPGRTEDGREVQPLPRALAQLLEYLSRFDAQYSKDWMPEHIEVIIWPHDYFTGPDLIWPGDWPDLTDPRTVKTENGYSLLIEGSRYQEVKDLLSSAGDGRGIRISDKLWAAHLRFPFPQEENWSRTERR